VTEQTKTTSRLSWGYLSEHREYAANLLIALLVVLGITLAWVREPHVIATDSLPPASLACPHTIKAVKGQVKVSGSAGTSATLNIFIGPGGGVEARDSSPLAVETGKLAPDTALCTITSDFVRSDGQILPAAQVTSRAVVTQDGRSVIVRVSVAPRYLQVSGFGEYSGTVSLDDPRASGGSVPVRIYIEYPYLNRVLLCGLLAAAFGLFWALIVRLADRAGQNNGQEEDTGLFWPSLGLRVAVLATAVPAISAQVLSNPGWTGSLSQYIKLATVAGAAAIATTPTLSAIVSKVTRTQKEAVAAPPDKSASGIGGSGSGGSGSGGSGSGSSGTEGSGTEGSGSGGSGTEGSGTEEPGGSKLPDGETQAGAGSGSAELESAAPAVPEASG
jgi:hypothetical protein